MWASFFSGLCDAGLNPVAQNIEAIRADLDNYLKFAQRERDGRPVNIASDQQKDTANAFKNCAQQKGRDHDRER